MTACSLPGVTLVCGAAGSVGNTLIQGWATAMSNAEAEMLKLVLTSWLSIPTPQLSGAGSAVTFIQSHVEFYTALALSAGLIVAGIRLMLEYRGEALRQSAYAIGRTILVIAAGSAAISLATAGGDHFSTWIVGQAANGATAASVLTTAGNLATAQAIAPGIVILLGLLAVIGMLVQIAMLLCRSAFLVILSGVWPLAAAVSTTEDGLAWYRRLTGWIVAFILFKPVAAIIYAAAIKMLVVNEGSEISVIEGVVLVVMASLALPALMRLMVPMTARVGGIAAGEVLAAGVGVAAGAALVAGTAGVGAALAGTGAAGATAGGGGAVGLAGGGGPLGDGPTGGGIGPDPAPEDGGGRSGGGEGISGGGGLASDTTGIGAPHQPGPTEAHGPETPWDSDDAPPAGGRSGSAAPGPGGPGAESGVGAGRLSAAGAALQGLERLASAPQRMGDGAVGGEDGGGE